MSFSLKCTLLLLHLIAPFLSHAIPRDVAWRQIETTHFRVIYESGQSDLAREYAQEAEWSYEVLKTVFSTLPDEKVTVVIADITDQANGMATFLPYPHIIVYPVLPNALDSIANYESWARDLVLHEHAHIMTFVPANGFYIPLKHIFGTIIRPTGILPRWYLEGLAVEIESRFTRGGRVRSPGSSATLRAMVQDGTLSLENMDRVNETSIPTYPLGQRPYLLGAALWRKITENHQAKSIDSLLLDYARRPPFLMDPPLNNLTQKDWPTFWRETRSELEQRASMQINLVKDAGEHLAEPFSAEGWHLSPSISPDGRYLVYIASNFWGGAEIRLAEKGDHESWRSVPFKSIVRGTGFLRLAWRPDGQGFIFEQIGTIRRFRQYSDLYFFDLRTRKSSRITTGERASEGSFHPSGEQVAYVRQSGGDTSLWLYQWDKGTSKVYQPPPGYRLSRPEFINSTQLIVAERNRSGEEYFLKVDLLTQEITPFLSDFKLVGMARNTSEGLLFVSRQTGVANLYLSRPPYDKAIAITNSTTEVIHGDIDPVTKELLLVELREEGRKLFSNPQLTEHTPPPLEPLLNSNFGPQVHVPPQVSRMSMTEEPYQPLSYLMPRYWIPFIYPVEGGMLFQGIIQSYDPLGRHNLQLDLNYDSVSSKLSTQMSYVNRTTPTDWLLYFMDRQDLLSSGADPLFLRQRAMQGGASFFIPGRPNTWTGSLMAQYQSSEIPLVGTPSRFIERAGPSVALNYSNMARDGFAAEHELNQSYSLRHTEFIQAGGLTGFGRTQFNSSLAWRGPLPLRHRLNGVMKATFAPEIRNSDLFLLGERTLGANYFVTLINSTTILRGYASGAFIARNLLSFNLSYDFPMADIFKGLDTWPVFLRNLNASIFVDAATLDGRFFNVTNLSYQSTKAGRFFVGSGIDFSLNTTLAYHVPLNFLFGLYYGFDPQAGREVIPFIGIGL